MSDTTHKFRTRKEAQAAAKEARARANEVEKRLEAARKAVVDAEAAREAVRDELRDAIRLADEAENEAAPVPYGSIVEVKKEFHVGSIWYGTWVKAGHYVAWTDDGEVLIKTTCGGLATVPRGRYRVVWTPWMGTPRPDLDELNGKAGEGAGGKNEGGVL